MISFKHIKLLFVLILLPFKVWADSSVGTLNGQFSVNETGAAVYSVPLNLFPSGTGFDPQIGVAYNSQLSGYGNVGYGVNITGLSSITRAGKDLFHDKKVEKIKYSKGDTYLLDGKRLYLKSGTYGYNNATYTVEGNPYVTVTQIGDDNIGAASYFIFTDANGVTYEYKECLLVPIGDANRTITWYLSKATNKYGDCIDYKYMTDNKVLYPSEITYGRNGEKHKVSFVYAALSKAQKFCFAGGWEGYINRRLTRIISYNGDSIYRRYDFTYNNSSDKPEDKSARKFDRLTSIGVYNGANEAFEPLTFNWQYLKSATISNSTCSTSIFDVFYGKGGKRNYEEDNIGILMAPDLNGDGIADIVRICQGGFLNGKKVHRTFVYISRSHMDSQGKVSYPDTIRYDFDPSFTFENFWGETTCSNNMSGGCAADIDGDGINDLVLPYYSKDDSAPNATLYFNYILAKHMTNKNTTNWSKVDKEFGFGLWSKGDCAPYMMMDFDGDGKTDILYVEDKKYNNCYNGRIVTDICGNFDCHDIRFSYTNDNKTIERMFSADCNADGFADIILIFDDGYKIYYNNGVSNINSIFSESNSKKMSGSELKGYFRMEQGDFDGDGLLDFACSNVTTLDIFRNNGNGTFSKVNTTRFSKTYGDDGHYAMRVADFNKDGISDLMISNQLFNGFDGVIIQWYVSHGINIENNTLELEPFNGAYKERDSDDAYEPYIFSGDFDGDGYAEIANYGSPLNKANDNTFQKNSINIYKFPTDVSLGRISSIENGFGKTTKITYASGTDSKVYKISSRDEDKYPVNTYTVALPLVSQVEQSNGAAGTQYLSYSYGDMRVHVKGRGMLGFTSMTVDNTTLGSKTETKVTDWDNSKYLPISVITTTTIGDKTSETQITNTIEVDNTWNGNYFSYCKEKLATDIDGHQIKTKYSYNLTNGVLTDERNYYDGKTDMYKNTKFSGHILYAGKYLPTSITYAQRHSDDNGNLSKVTHNYIYDKGEIIKDEQVSWYGNKNITLTTTYTRDDYGNVLTEVTSGSNVIAVKKCYEYDDNHLRIVRSYTDPASVVTTYKYDSWGNLINKSNETDASNILSTTYTYDKWGNLIKTVNPDGTYTSVTTEWDTTPTNDGSTYGSVYKTVTCASAQAPVTVYYDSEGREVNSSTIGLDGVNITKVTHYDSKGNVAHVVNTTGQLQTSSILSYDAFGRLTSQKNSDGSYIENTYGDRTVTVKTPTGNVIKTYDAWGNITNIKDQIGKDVAYKYYSNGKPSSIETNGNKVTQEYDAAGNRIKMVDPDAGTMTYTYASDGTLLSETDARGVTTTYTYDLIGRLSKRVYNDKTSNNITDMYIYCTGAHIYNIARQRRGNKYKYYEYDPYGRITSIKSEVPEKSTTKTYITSYKYNNDGLKSEVTYPGNVVFNYNYDSNGFLSEIKLNNSKSVYSLISYNGLSLKSNTVAGVMEKIVDSDGYDSEYKLHGKDYQEFNYEKTTGNLQSRYWKNGNDVMVDETFKYDKLDRLILVNSGGKKILSMDYHPNGNIVEKSDIGWYNYESNKVHAVTSIDQYNKNIDDKLVQTTFDLNGKISKISKTSCGTMTFVYGADNEKIYSRESNIGEHIYLGNYEKIIKNNVSTEYYFLENDVIVTRKTGTSGSSSIKVYQAVTDNLGSILAVYGENNNLVFKAKYDVWGKQTVDKNDINLYYGYTGHEMLPSFDLINMEGRLYDPIIGRFLSCDNYVQQPTNSQNFNRYSYCINNPLKYTDPSGNLFGIDDVTLMFAAYSLFTSVATAAAEGQNVWKAAGMSLLTSVASYGLGCATSAIGSQLGHGLGTFGTEMARAGAHGLVNGAYNAITGNSFGSGFATGFVSSLVGSGTQALGWSSDATLSSMFFAGGFSSLFTGGDFLSGAMTGYSIGALNHTWEEDGIKYSDENDPRYTATGLLPEYRCVGGKLLQRIGEANSALGTMIGAGSFNLDRAIRRTNKTIIRMGTGKELRSGGGRIMNSCIPSVKVGSCYPSYKFATTVAQSLKGAGYVSGVGSLVITGIDSYNRGQLQASHVVEAGVTCLSFIPTVGWMIGGAYMCGDMIHKHLYGRSIGDRINEMYDGGVILRY